MGKDGVEERRFPKLGVLGGRKPIEKPRVGMGVPQGQRLACIPQVKAKAEVRQIEGCRPLPDRVKLMGFGHRVYKNGDHRAPILRGWGLKLADRMGPQARKWFDLAAAAD